MPFSNLWGATLGPVLYTPALLYAILQVDA